MEFKDIDKSKILKAFNECGDGLGLDEIQRQLEYGDYIDTEANKLLDFLYKLNCLLIETEQESYAAKYNTKIQELYSELKADLFKKLGIEEKE